MSKDRKSQEITLRYWFDEADGSIHLASTDPQFISTVNARTGSARCHAHFFAHLARTLRDAGLPAPPERT
jgi:hypothetical protein